MLKLRAFCLLAVLVCAAASAGDLTDANGENVGLDDYVGHGHWVMVNVWSPGCSHCMTELPTLISYHADNAAGATILGLAVDYPGFGQADREALAAFRAEHGINFPVIATSGDGVGRFLGESVDLVPVTFAYDPAGRLVARWHGVITTADIDEIIRDFTPPGP